MAEDDGVVVDHASLDQGEYFEAIKVLQKYSNVVAVTNSSTPKTMGHAVQAKPTKEFLTLNAAEFGSYLDTIVKNLEKGKPTKPFPLFNVPVKQYAFSDPQPWQLTAPLEQSDSKLVMDKMHNIQNYWLTKKRFTDMESQLWAGTGACSHLDHFLHGMDKAITAAITTLDTLSRDADAKGPLAPVVQQLLDAQLMRRTAGRNNIHVAQTLLNGASNMQVIRRDTELRYHHRLLELADITQLRALPLGQKDLFGPALIAKARKLDALKSSEAKETIMALHKKAAAVASPFPKAQAPKTTQQPQTKGSYVNHYGQTVHDNTTKNSRNFRGGRRGGRGGGWNNQRNNKRGRNNNNRGGNRPPKAEKTQ